MTYAPKRIDTRGFTRLLLIRGYPTVGAAREVVNGKWPSRYRQMLSHYTQIAT
jgi:hypothetical protein